MIDEFNTHPLESEASIKAKIGYPEYIFDIHEPLFKIATVARENAEEKIKLLGNQEKTKMRADIEDRLFDFFIAKPESYRGVNWIYPDAMGALGLTINRFARPNSSVLLLDPAYEAFEKMANRAGDGDRKTIHIDCTEDPSIDQINQTINETEKDHPISLIVVNIPRNPDMKVYEENFLVELAEIADRKNMTILYDETFIFANPATANVKLEKNGNFIATTFPRSKSSILIRDTGKLLPEPFSKLAFMQVSHQAISEGGGSMLNTAHLWHYATPRIADMNAIAEVLHSNQFPELVTKIHQLNQTNFEALNAEISIPMVNCGPFVLIDFSQFFQGKIKLDLNLSLIRFSMSAKMLSSYYGSGLAPESAHSIMRLPLTVDKKIFPKTIQQLKSVTTFMKDIQAGVYNFPHIHHED